MFIFIGFQIEEIIHKGNYFKLCDIGGGCKIHALWVHYFEFSQGQHYLLVLETGGIAYLKKIGRYRQYKAKEIRD